MEEDEDVHFKMCVTSLVSLFFSVAHSFVSTPGAPNFSDLTRVLQSGKNAGLGTFVCSSIRRLGKFGS